MVAPLVELVSHANRDGPLAPHPIPTRAEQVLAGDYRRTLGPARASSARPPVRGPGPGAGAAGGAHSVECRRWVLSQLLHIEQAALLGAAAVVAGGPTIEVKLAAAELAADEAGHVDGLRRYLEERHGGPYPVCLPLRSAIDAVLADPRWDVVLLGTQVVLEGFSVAGCASLAARSADPDLDALAHRLVDEERGHARVAARWLPGVYGSLTAPEVRERQEVVVSIAEVLRNELVMQEVWDWMSLPAADAARVVAYLPDRHVLRNVVLSRVRPACDRLGLLDAGATAPGRGWLRQQLARMAQDDLVSEGRSGRAP